MIELKDLRSELHYNILRGRSIKGLVNSLRFEILWLASSVTQKEEVLELIRSKNKSKVLEWVNNHPSISMEEMNILKLKEIARCAGIKNYSRLSKYELVGELQKRGVKK